MTKNGHEQGETGQHLVGGVVAMPRPGAERQDDDDAGERVMASRIAGSNVSAVIKNQDLEKSANRFCAPSAAVFDGDCGQGRGYRLSRRGNPNGDSNSTVQRRTSALFAC